MKKKMKTVKNKLLLFVLLFTTGCSGAIFGFHNLDKQYEEKKSNNDIELYYTPAETYIAATIRNVSNTFFSGLNISLECLYNTGETVSDIHSINNLKTYYYKEVIFKVDYEKCDSIILYYTYYPQSDGGFVYRDKFGSIPYPEENYIPVDGVLVIK